MPGTNSVNGSLVLNGSTSGAVTFNANAVTTPYPINLPAAQGAANTFPQNDGSGNLTWVTAGGSGTVTSVSVTTANGVSGSVATATTTPAITLTLGAITPSTIAQSGKTITYNGVTTAGWGVHAVNGFQRLTGLTAANASIATVPVGVADGSFDVSAQVTITSNATYSFTVTCTYTDDTNTSNTVTLIFYGATAIAGTLNTTIANTLTSTVFQGIPIGIRAKAGTAITIATTGTFTSVMYNTEGRITQVG